MNINTVNFPPLNLALSELSLAEILELFRLWQAGPEKRSVATANPEFIIAAKTNQQFLQALQKASLVVCDGIGLKWATKWLTGESVPRITGVELSQALLTDQSGQFKIFLLGGAPGIAQKVAMRYAETVVGSQSGGTLDANYQLNDQAAVIEAINASGANVLLVAFGQVKQELWIDQYLSQLQNIKIAIGVGGTLDYLSGTVSRAPQLMRQLGLEWLYRLIRQPKRLPRIINATVRFSLLVIKYKFLHAK